MSSLALICVFALLAYICIRRMRQLPTPPGPRGLPIVGNALQMPKKHAWLAFTEWANEYGQVSPMLMLKKCMSDGTRLQDPSCISRLWAVRLSC